MHNIELAVLIGLLIITANIMACGDDQERADDEPQEIDTGVSYEERNNGGGTNPNVHDRVYAHSAETLYAINPDDLSLTVVGDFQWPGETDQMTDIALDADGNMVGVSFFRIYAVDPETAACTLLANFDGGEFNGLGFVEGVGGEESATLIGATHGGQWYAVNPDTGATRLTGSYGDAIGSSGDLAYIRDAGTYATIEYPDYATDGLATIDPDTGAATVIGETGFLDIWGVAYWAGEVFGFTGDGEFLRIDVDTGEGTVVESSSRSFWGAGVTPLAPVV